MIGVRLAEIAVELDDLAAQVEERGITDADRLLLISGHRHLQLAVESLNLELGAVYEQDERELLADVTLGVAA